MKATKFIGGAIAAIAVAGSLSLAYAQSEGAKAPGVNPINPAGTPAGPGMQQAPSTAAGMNGSSSTMNNSSGSMNSGSSTMDNSATSGQTTERAAQTDRN